MNQQENPVQQPIHFGRAQPIRLFDNEPSIVIFDLNNFITDSHIDLRPFDRIVFMTNDGDALRNRLANFNELFTIASIFPQWNHHQTQEFVQQNLLTYETVRLLYLFYTGIQLNLMIQIGGNRIADCFPITVRIPAQLRQICSMTNDLNIAYCERKRIENEANDVGIAKVYAQQKGERVNLQVAYNRFLLQQIEGQLFV